MLHHPRRTAGLLAGALLGTLLCAAPALAEPDPAPPNCTAADLARISASVAAETAGYLYAHPEVNDYFTGLKDTEREQFGDDLRAYMDAHPETHADLQRIRRPLTDQRERCQ